MQCSRNPAEPSVLVEPWTGLQRLRQRFLKKFSANQHSPNL
jgi:hypothetical protein